MNASLRVLFSATVVGLLALGLFGLRFACSLVDVSAVRSSMEVGQLREATFRRVNDRRQVVHEVINWRCTLTDALEQLQQLDGEWPDYHQKAPEVAEEGSRAERSYQ